MTALEKFLKAMNTTSLFWTKNHINQLEIITQNGEIVIIKCDGFSFMSDEKEK